ncbi:Salicylate hydroxylase [Botryosphaeria dothidea]|uniref:Salicylate hydroxylase n=1 Tax=Botryosphaeria dothidea TaxID=55169 RepID=A0A8H4NAW1_9PEZI|nr:Salicylate hydroxylase [Botryosphaeria dothidea]
MSSNAPLDVGIVGGGIAGLSAAIALKRGGHNVEIYEKRNFGQDAGITLAIAPNAGKVYQKWGFDLQAECGGVEAFQVRHVDGASANVVWRDDWKEFPKIYGSKVIFLRHGDVHSGLLRLLDATEGLPAVVSTEIEVTGVNCEKGLIYMADGSVVQKDLVVLANGLNGKFLKQITGEDCPLQDTGLSFFRYLIPNSDVLEDSQTGPLFKDEPDEICFFPHFASGASIVTYLCEGGKTRAVNVFAKRLPGEGGKRDRGAKISRDELLSIANNFHPSIQAMLEKAPEDRIFSYPLMTRDPVQKYTNGRAVTIGDAAHVMKPQQGQGASIAIESTGCLEILFNGIGKDQVQERLALFEKLRLGRCGPVHVFSNMLIGPDGHRWMVEKVKPFWDESRPLPPPGSRPLSLPFRNFIYGFNVVEDTEQALAAQQANGPVNGNGFAAH